MAPAKVADGDAPPDPASAPAPLPMPDTTPSLPSILSFHPATCLCTICFRTGLAATDVRADPPRLSAECGEAKTWGTWTRMPLCVCATVTADASSSPPRRLLTGDPNAECEATDDATDPCRLCCRLVLPDSFDPAGPDTGNRVTLRPPPRRPAPGDPAADPAAGLAPPLRPAPPLAGEALTTAAAVCSSSPTSVTEASASSPPSSRADSSSGSGSASVMVCLALMKILSVLSPAAVTSSGPRAWQRAQTALET